MPAVGHSRAEGWAVMPGGAAGKESSFRQGEGVDRGAGVRVVPIPIQPGWLRRRVSQGEGPGRRGLAAVTTLPRREDFSCSRKFWELGAAPTSVPGVDGMTEPPRDGSLPTGAVEGRNRAVCPGAGGQAAPTATVPAPTAPASFPNDWAGGSLSSGLAPRVLGLYSDHSPGPCHGGSTSPQRLKSYYCKKKMYRGGKARKKVNAGVRKQEAPGTPVQPPKKPAREKPPTRARPLPRPARTPAPESQIIWGKKKLKIIKIGSIT